MQFIEMNWRNNDVVAVVEGEELIDVMLKNQQQSIKPLLDEDEFEQLVQEVRIEGMAHGMEEQRPRVCSR